MKILAQIIYIGIAAFIGLGMTAAVVVAEANNAHTDQLHRTPIHQRVAQREVPRLNLHNVLTLQRQYPVAIGADAYDKVTARRTPRHESNGSKIQKSNNSAIIKYQSPYMSVSY